MCDLFFHSKKILNHSKNIGIALSGTVLEYYDYALYGFCGPTMAPLFFPEDLPQTALLKTFSIFFLGTVSKLLGAFIFSYIGDKWGRSFALKISLVGIALPTFLMGMMPTYHQIGKLAPFCLLMFRMLQGIFTAGESEGARLYLYETWGQTRPSLANSLMGCACMLGIYLSSLAAAWMSHQAYEYAWRIPFLVGGSIGFLIFLGRLCIPETPIFMEYQKKKEAVKVSFLEIVFKNKRAMGATVLLCGSVGGAYHFYFIFLKNYLLQLNWVTPQIISSFIPKALLIYTLIAPLSGMLADRYGAYKILKIFSVILLGVGLMNVGMAQFGKLPLFLIGLTSAALSFFQAPGFALLYPHFKVGERYRAISLGHAMGSLFFSGSAPFISLWLWQSTHLTLAPFLYFLCLIGMGGLALGILSPLERAS